MNFIKCKRVLNTAKEENTEGFVSLDVCVRLCVTMTHTVQTVDRHHPQYPVEKRQSKLTLAHKLALH